MYEAAQNLEVFQTVKTEIKKLKTGSGWCPFQGLSNGTTLMQIQSGRTVPLKGLSHEIDFKNFDKNLQNLV